MVSPDEEMRIGTHNGHLMVAALRRHHDKPVIHLGDVTLTGREVSERISQYVQAFESLNAGQGTAGALLALNRPEVLFLIIGASQTQGYRRTSLHPLGSLDDHAYVINDAEITTLIVDPVFVERALGLLEKCPGQAGPDHRASARGAGARGHRPHRGRGAVRAGAGRGDPAAARPHDLDHLHRRHHRQPQGRDRAGRVVLDDDRIQLAEWEWPENPRFLMCTPLSHAGAAFFAPVVIKGGSLYVMSVRPGEVLEFIEKHKIQATMLVPSMLYALMDHPDSHTRDLSSLETIYYGASAINPVRLKEAIDRFGPIFAQYYGQSEAPMVHHLPEASRTTSPAKTAALSPRAAGRRRASALALLDDDGNPVAAGRAGRDLRARARWCPAATGSCPSRPPRPSATAGCTPATWPARTRTASGTSSTAPRT